MAVLTPIRHDQLVALLERYPLPPLLRFEGVAAGIENSTYFVILEGPIELVLTLYEQLDSTDLHFLIALADHLAGAGLPVAVPLRTNAGAALQQIAQRPALLFPRLPGATPASITPAHCHALGQTMARLHRATQDFTQIRPLPLGAVWMAATLNRCRSQLADEDSRLLDQLLQDYQQLLSEQPQLPSGVIHADLFPDNILFVDTKLSAVIDFGRAGYAPWLLDLAIALNAWSYSNGRLQTELAQALLAGYQQSRPFTPAEQAAWRTIHAMAAAQLWLSRLLLLTETTNTTRYQMLLQEKPPQSYRALCRAILTGEVHQPLPA